MVNASRRLEKIGVDFHFPCLTRGMTLLDVVAVHSQGVDIKCTKYWISSPQGSWRDGSRARPVDISMHVRCRLVPLL